MSQIEIKIAESPEELAQVYELRYQILRKAWDQPRGTEVAEDEAQATSVLALLDGTPVATARLHSNSPEQAQVRYMAVYPNVQGKGVGRQVLTFCEALAREWGASEMLLNARQNAIPFYEACGYAITADSYLLWGVIPHKEMRKAL